MRELRKDPILGRWVIVATNRAERPYEFPKSRKPDETRCLYCEDDPLVESAARAMPSEQAILEGHEAIIECAGHDQPIDALSDADARRLVETYAARVAHHASDPANAYALIFKNNAMTDRLGRGYIRHARSEVVPLPVVPKRVLEELREAGRFYAAEQKCVFCAVLDEERRAGARVIDENASFTAFCPYASHSPYETMILPRRHQASLSDMTAAEKNDFAQILKSALGRIRVHLNDCPYYFVLHGAPFEPDPARGAKTAREFHWHVEIAPRTFHAAGFEWGGGVYINPIVPEHAAGELRKCAWNT